MTQAELMREAIDALREAARVEAAHRRQDDDPQWYLHDYIVTTADGLEAELDMLVKP